MQQTNLKEWHASNLTITERKNDLGYKPQHFLSLQERPHLPKCQLAHILL